MFRSYELIFSTILVLTFAARIRQLTSSNGELIRIGNFLWNFSAIRTFSFNIKITFRMEINESR